MASHVLAFILDALRQAGWPVLFIVMVLEMGMIIHFVPTELVLVAAASELATTPFTMLMVVLVATAGSALGSLLPYWAGFYGGRGFLERHQRFFHVSPARLEKLEKLFQRRAGAALVLGLRIVPGLRTAPSIPAGLARMRWRPYLLLTTLGTFAFNFVLVYATYASRHPSVPLGEELVAARQAVEQEAGQLVAYWAARWWLGLLLLALLGTLTVFIWRRWSVLRAQPIQSTLSAMRFVAWAAAGVGGILLLGALLLPNKTYHLIAWFAIDFPDWAATTGFGDAVLVLIVASGFASLAALAFGLVPALRWLRDRSS